MVFTTAAEVPDEYRGADKLIFGIVLAVITFWLFAQTTLNVAPTMLNVGLTQRLSDITGQLKNYPFALNTRSQGSCDTPISMMSVPIRAAHR